MRQKTIRTPRLLLLPSHPRLARRAANFYHQNAAFFAPYDPLRPAGFATVAHQRALLRAEHSAAAEKPLPRALRYWLAAAPPGNARGAASHREPGPLIGTVALGGITGGGSPAAFVSYKLARCATGRGYATEALQALVSLAFGQLGLHRLVANIMPGNAPSLRLAQRLGFQNNGLLPKHLRIAGTWQDHIHLVLPNPAAE